MLHFERIPAVLAAMGGLMLSTTLSAQLDCTADEKPVEISIGTTTSQDLEPDHGYPGGQGTIEWLDFIYQAPVKESTTRGIEFLGLNPNGTFRDSEDPAYSERDREFLGVSGTGRYDFRMCLPEDTRGGLVHAVYANDGSPIGFLSAPTPVVEEPDGDARIDAVVNKANSAAIGSEFVQEGSGQDRLAALVVRVLEAYGVADAGAGEETIRRLVQDSYTSGQVFSTYNDAITRALLHNTEDAYVEGNTVYVTGDGARADVTRGVDDITRANGASILSGWRVDDLEHRVGETLTGAYKHGAKPINVREGRTNLITNTGSCEDGEFDLGAVFQYENPTLEGTITAYHNGQEITSTSGTRPELATTLDCDTNYTIRGSRTTPQGNKLPTSNKNIHVEGEEPEPQEPEIVGYDFDGDGVADVVDADGDNIFDSVINVGCNDPFDHTGQLIVEPEGTYGYDSNFGGTVNATPSGMSLNQGTGEIIYDPPCDDQGVVHVPQFRATGSGGSSDWMNIQFRVN